MPTDFGSRLRDARERRGLSLGQIAAVTKITRPALEALEANDPSKLPGGIFSRAFVKAYAHEVGLDPEATVREFIATFAPEVEPVQPPVVPQSAAEPPARWVGALLAAAVLIAAAVIGLRFVGWPGASSPGAPAATASPAATVPLPVARHTPEPPPAASPDVDDVPAGDVAATTPPPVEMSEPVPALATAASAVDDGLMRLSFRPQGGPCWVEVVADGRMELSREIGAGETETRAARDAFEVKVGDAGRCTYTLNDRPGRPLGPAGKVVRVRIDRQSLGTFFQGS